MTTTSHIPTTAPPEHPSARFRRRLRVAVTLLVLAVLAAVCLALVSQLAMWRASVAVESREHQTARGWLRLAGWTWFRGGEWYYLSAILERRQQNFTALRSHLEIANQLNWPVADLERQQLLALAQSGQFTDVADRWSELFQNARSDGPEICRAFVNYSLARFQLAEAAQVIDAWKTDFADDAEAWFVEGRILSVLQRWPDAERSLRQALKRSPDHLPALRALGHALVKQLKFAEAETVLRSANKLDSEDAELQAALASSLTQQGKTQEADLLLQATVKQYPKNPDVLAELGRLELALGHNEQAVEHLNRVVKIHPENTELRYSLAQALRALGREDEARQHFQLVDEGTKALLQLSRLTSEIVADPGNVELRFKVASITWNWRSRADGEAWLKSVLEYDPHHSPTHELLARHYAAQGRDDLAADHRQMAGAEDRIPVTP